jgi:phage replication O-like protein O
VNWTKFPNDVLEKLARAPLPKGHFKIFLAVLRETVGFGRDSASLSLTRLAKLTWLRRDKVSEALAGMKAFRILEITPANGRRAAEIIHALQYLKLT